MGKDTARQILQAYGYTPQTLAADLGVTRKVANRILYGENSLKFNDLLLIIGGIKGVSMDFLSGMPGPGKAKSGCKAKEHGEHFIQRRAMQPPHEKRREYADIIANIVRQHSAECGISPNAMILDIQEQIDRMGPSECPAGSRGERGAVFLSSQKK